MRCASWYFMSPPRRGVRVGLGVALALFGAGMVGGEASAAQCPRPERPARVILDTGFAEPKLDTSKSRRELKAIMQSMSGAAILGNTVGLTTTRPAYSYQIQISVQPQRSGDYCAYLNDVTMRFAYESVVVHVAREYPRGGCPYAVTLDHERRHVEIYRQGYERYLPKLNAALAEAARRINPVKLSRLEQAQPVVLARFKKAIEPSIQAFNRDQQRKNMALDTPESYAAERAKCTDW